jgi:hypothetical protein
MPLINFQTDLTNLPWGRDRRDGGSSNQPYITKAIPDGLESDDLPLRSGPDFLLRNGFLAPLDALKDVSRLAQMFVDVKSPAGLLFIAKQNLLSRNSVKTQASVGIGYAGPLPLTLTNTQTGVLMEGGGLINAGIYTPLSTLGQALGGFAGLHLNQLGLDPTSPMSGIVEGGLFPGAGLTTYESIVGQERILNINPNTDDGGPNRLVNLKYFIDEDGSSPKVNLFSYSGGPGSILGIGKTNIKFADQRTGAANPQSTSNSGSFYEGGAKFRSYGESIPGLSKFKIGTESTGAAYQYLFYNTGVSEESLFDTSNTPSIKIGYNGPTQNFLTSVNSIVNSEDFVEYRSNPSVLYKNNSVTFDQTQLIAQDNVIEGGQSSLFPTDFRKELYTFPETGSSPSTTEKSTVLSLSPSYRSKNIDVRFNMGQPGKQGGNKRGDAEVNGLGKNVWNYGIDALELEALDKITAMPMYSGVGPDVNQPINDAVKFRIAAINNDRSDGEAVYMHFRAFLNDFSDSYTSTWNSVNYVGRGDSLYNYAGFGRTISLGFTVAAQSKAELIPMYKKLNYLASTLAPDYSEAGFMRGNMVRLTIGGYLYEQPGFITSLTYTVPQTSPWEIAINAEGGSDSSVKELPHIIEVSGFSFTPIHTFLPEKPNDANFATDGNGNKSSRFIALSNGVNSNYDDEYRTYEPNGTSDGDNNSATI